MTDKSGTLPTKYYVREAGIGIAIEHHPKRSHEASSMKIGVIGLGAGTISAYGRTGDQITFYEINPDVVRRAHEHFGFLAAAEQRGCKVEVFLGDARLWLEQQLASNERQQFDVLAVDAFFSVSDILAGFFLWY